MPTQWRINICAVECLEQQQLKQSFSIIAHNVSMAWLNKLKVMFVYPRFFVQRLSFFPIFFNMRLPFGHTLFEILSEQFYNNSTRAFVIDFWNGSNARQIVYNLK